MPRPTYPLIVLAILLVEPVAAQQLPDSVPEQITPESMEEGYKLFHENRCRNCHGELARGGVGGPSLRDLDWLHVDGRRVLGSYAISFAGIVDVILWGVRESEIKARGRIWAMQPDGGALFTDVQREAVAAYLWGQYYGLYEESEEDLWVELLLDRPVDEARELMLEDLSRNGEPPVSAERIDRVAGYAFNLRPMERGIEIVELGLELYPDDVDLLFTRVTLVDAWARLVARSEEAIAQAIEAAEDFLEVGEDHPNRERVVRILENLRLDDDGRARDGERQDRNPRGAEDEQ